MDLRHTDVVKYVGMTDTASQAASTRGAAAGSGMPAGAPAQIGGERSTRATIARLILENGPVSAAALSTRLGLTPAAVRRHRSGRARSASGPANRQVRIRIRRSLERAGDLGGGCRGRLSADTGPTLISGALDRVLVAAGLRASPLDDRTRAVRVF